jgi:hypothetical protein
MRAQLPSLVLDERFERFDASSNRWDRLLSVRGFGVAKVVADTSAVLDGRRRALDRPPHSPVLVGS